MNVNTLIIESKTTTILERRKHHQNVLSPKVKLKHFVAFFFLLLGNRNTPTTTYKRIIPIPDPGSRAARSAEQVRREPEGKG